MLAIAGSQIESGNATLSAQGVSSLLNTQGLIAGLGNLNGSDSFVGIIRAIAEDQNSNIFDLPF